MNAIRWLTPACLGMLACTSASALSGRVIDEGSGRPMHGVTVIGVWQGVLRGFGEPKSTCYHLETAVTNEEGKFSMDNRSLNLNPLLMDRDNFVQGAYKRGYHLSEKPSPVGVYVMAQNQEGQFEQIGTKLRFDCPADELKKLTPVLKSVYEEAIQAARTPRQRELADGWLFAFESISLGRDAAKYNMMARQRAQAEGSSQSRGPRSTP